MLGATALLARKGAPLHRTSGRLFVAAMVTMGLSGSAMALQHGVSDPNVTAGLLPTLNPGPPSNVSIAVADH